MTVFETVVSANVMLALGFCVACLAMVVLICQPKTGVLLAFAIKPFVDMFWWSKVHAGLSPLHIMGVGVPLVAAVGIWRSRLAPRPCRLDRIVLLYLAVLSFSTLIKLVTVPEHSINAIDAFVRIGSVTAFYWIGKYLFKQRRDQSLLVTCLVASLTIPFGTTLLQQGFSIQTVDSKDVFAANPKAASNEVSGFYMGARHGIQRISGVYEGVYELAFLGVLAVTIGLALADAHDVRAPVLTLILLAVGAYFLLFTYSRSAWAVMAGTIVLYQVLRRRVLLALTIVAACVAAYFLSETVHHRFEDEVGALTGMTEFDRLGYGRGGVWRRVVQNFNDWPLDKRLLGGFGIGNPENQFLNMMVFFGYAGLAAMILMMLASSAEILHRLTRLSHRWNRLDNAKVAFGCLVVSCYWLAGHGNGFNTQISMQWVLWTWTGIIVADTSQTRPLERDQKTHASLSQ